MITLLIYGLIAAACWIVASAIFTLLLGLALRGLARDPRPARPPAADAGGSFPAVTAAGLPKPRIRRGTPRSTSRLVLVPGREEGPAAGDAAGPTNLFTP